MAQIGCYVPAKAATFKIVDAVLTRVTTSDNMECNASTFALEMKEVSYILSFIQNQPNEVSKSHYLILMDELGRSTSSEEGAALSWAIVEEIVKIGGNRIFCFLATHFALLARLEDLYCTVSK